MAGARGHYTPLRNLMGSLNVFRHHSLKEIAKKQIKKRVSSSQGRHLQMETKNDNEDDIATIGEIIYR
jgi:hypothetical protein